LLQVNAKSSEANLNYPNMPDEQLHYLVFRVEVDDAPTQQQYAVFEALSQQAAPLIAKWKEIRSSELVALSNQIQQNVPAIYLSPERTRSRAPDGSEKSADTQSADVSELGRSWTEPSKPQASTRGPTRKQVKDYRRSFLRIFAKGLE
jgi:hypothetical protein